MFGVGFKSLAVIEYVRERVGYCKMKIGVFCLIIIESFKMVVVKY